MPSPGLERPVWLCQPSMERFGKISSQREGTSSRADDTCSSSVALPMMVTQTPHLISCRAIHNQSPGKLCVGGSGRVLSSTPPTASHVACLRRHYTDEKLSREASDLLLSSWRWKPAQLYGTLCKRWIGWCSERNDDLVSGPIEDVVIVLAYLHTKEYQYRSLNSYRSAIAFMHIPIDGVWIGQRPLVSWFRHTHLCRDAQKSGMFY